MRRIRFGTGMVAVLLALALVSCKKKPAEKKQPAQDQRAAMDMDTAMDAVMKPAPPMRPVARKAPVPTQSDPEAIKVLDAALQAHGGLDKLKKGLSAHSGEAKGKYYGRAYTSRIWWKAPDKMVMDITNFNMKMGYVGKTCWTQSFELTVDCQPAEAKLSQEMLRSAHWGCLYPLKDKGVVLQKAAPKKVDGKDTVGFKATAADGSFAATFYFDAKTHLMVSMGYRGHWSGMKVGQLETVVKGYKKVGGIMMPVKSAMRFNGQLVIEETVGKYIVGKVDDKAFAKPAQVEFGKVFVRKVPDMTVAFTTHKGPHEKIGPAIGKLVAWMGKNKLSPMGPPMFAYLKMGKDKTKFVTEILMHIMPAKGAPPKGAGFGVKDVKATTVALSYEKGPYTALDKKYAKLEAWIKKNKYKIAGPPMMVGYSNPMTTKPADLINQILFAVKK